MKRTAWGATILVLVLLAALVTASDGAVKGAGAALRTCGGMLIPSLFPFFVISYLINHLSLPVYLGQKLQTPMALLFGTSGTGAGVFLLGCLGGYPLGAAVLADLVARGDLSPKEGRKLLCFCNNSGPAFLIGAVGVGVFHSSAAGLLLYGVHLLAAFITGLFLSGTQAPAPHSSEPLLSSVNLSTALPEAISKASLQLLQICGYVVFFGAVTGVLEELGIFSQLYGSLSQVLPLTLQQTRALCMGLLELGCGIGALSGAPLTPQSLTVCALITGFGGVSVALQTAGVLSGSRIPLRYHLLGRVCCGGIGAFLMFTISSILL